MVTQRQSSLTVACLCSLVITTLQMLACVRSLPLNFGEPLSGLLGILSLVVLRLEFLELECALPGSFLGMYVAKMLMPFVAGGILLVGEFFRSKMRGRRYYMDDVVNTFGGILVSFYIMLSLVCLSPFQCFQHPSGHREALAQDPRVFCWEDEGVHVPLVYVSIVVIIMYPVTILSMSLWVTVWMYPKMVIKNDLHFLRRFRFLFIRWTPSRPTSSIVLLIKSFIIALIPTVIPPVYAEVQVTLMFFTLMIGLVVHIVAWPWRIVILNYLDSLFQGQSLVVVFVASLALGQGGELSPAMSVVTSILIMTVLFATFAYIGLHVLKSRPKHVKYEAFISHHKSGAGSAARMIKCLLERELSGICFLDADHLDDVDNLFDAVRQSNNVVVVLSGATLTRPWCVGEVVTAWMCKICTIPLVLFEPQENANVDAIQGLVGDDYKNALWSIVQKLTRFGIDEVMVGSSLESLFQTPKVLLDVKGGEQHQESGIKALISAMNNVWFHGTRNVTWVDRLLFSMSDREKIRSQKSFTPSNVIYAYLCADPDDLEAVCAAVVLKQKLQLILQERVFVDADRGDSKVLEVISQMNQGRALVLVTRNTFQSPRQLARLVLLLRKPKLHPLPILGVSGEDILTPGSGAILTSLAATGAPVAASPAEAQRLLCEAASEFVGLHETAAAVEILCKYIMDKFDAAMQSNLKLDATAADLAQKLKKINPTESRKALLPEDVKDCRGSSSDKSENHDVPLENPAKFEQALKMSRGFSEPGVLEKLVTQTSASLDQNKSPVSVSLDQYNSPVNSNGNDRTCRSSSSITKL